MMRNFCLIFIFICLSTASADEKTDAKKQTEVERSDTSLDNRNDKSLQASVGLGFEYSYSAYIYQLGYFIQPFSVLLLRFTKQTSTENTSWSHNAKTLSLGNKRFLGNSFNFQPSFFYRDGIYLKSVSHPYKDLGVGIRIGNEWQSDNFFIGIDWVGLNYAFVNLTKKDFSDIYNTLTVTLTAVNIGYSF